MQVEARPPLTAAVVGLGMMGRHHARLLQSLDGVRFVGAADGAGDVHGVLADPALLRSSVEELVERDRPDMLVVAVPTEHHLPVVESAAAAGCHVLVEKPVAASVAEAERVIDACARAGVRGAVGHVERHNPALREMRRRIADGQIGDVVAISGERSGPFPDRIRDVGVVKDLASHDLDLAMWLGGAEVASLAARTQFRAGRQHEDLVMVTGDLENGVSFNLQVDWLTPTKTRRTRVLGTDGMLVADSLRSELQFYENGRVRIEWTQSQQFKGVSEGDVTRYALQQREPLRVELEAFRDLVTGDDDAPVVSLERGLCVLRAAEAALQSASTGSTVSLATVQGAA
ncbi:MAG: Gfo/Idh/MocA family oxidoreductase [Solirubrobacteraceae bacterium]|nr:Gfo/Idh/MocA family oxidoreductase [Solirubrobacteraceae bacterium]